MHPPSLHLGLMVPIGVSSLLLATACTPASMARLASEEPPMNSSDPDLPSPIVGERQACHRQALYGAGVLQPAAPADLTTLGLGMPPSLPALVVFATEHPHLPPPRLGLQTLRGEPALVLSWLEYDVMQGPLPEVAPITYAWPVQDPAPRLLILRKVQHEDSFDVPLAEPSEPEVPGQGLGFEAAEGPGVSLDPAYLTRGAELFFAQYGQPRPTDLVDSLLLAAIRPTASGRRGRALGAVPLGGGGTRARLAVPLDPGLPIWGPRDADRVDIFAFPDSGGRSEWLLELE